MSVCPECGCELKAGFCPECAWEEPPPDLDPPSSCLLEVVGRSPTALAEGELLKGFLAVAVVPLLIFASLLGVAWLAERQPAANPLGLEPRILVVLALVVGGAAALVGIVLHARRGIRRRGSVQFHAGEITIHKGGAYPKRTVAWSGLTGYTARSPDYVQLHRQGEVWPSVVLTVPTPGEEERHAVIAALNANGVAHVE